MTSKGQLTVPKGVRDALGLDAGDAVVFDVEGDRAVMFKSDDLLDLAGAVPVPDDVRGLPWREVRRRARER